MEFEYDPNKSKSNQDKYSINFDEAKHLWEDVNRLEIQAKSETEPRYALIAIYGDKLWTAFFTIRNSKIRIISVRRARKGEGRLYYES